MKHWFRAAAVVMIAPLILTACLFTPGKFVSSLTINKDRSFTYTYKGEVIAIDPDSMDGMAGSGDTMGEVVEQDVSEDGAVTNSVVEIPEDGATAAEQAAAKAEKKAKRDKQFRELAVQLAKEPGYSKVEYLGDGKFFVDYSISGVLTHNFVYPFNQDSGLIFPWVAIELRGKDTVRVKAPGFAKQDMSGMGMAGAGSGGAADGTASGSFTLTTDAEIVSQNNEDGATKAAGKSSITWNVTPITKDAPMAVLRVVPR
ncbi:hypothetical protein [Sphingomonas sp. G-3-2-10]|uniref:hypothetical protein n=1 Tax=Sphingomonas sp. G-3-2-10 TaxID=2728838 RepID=UPI00146B6B4B|nr:hypothetical protein [Sphingomonas sp. G-3-2-10]NML07467.1 hypothetical protein [Sphingomonas sp. G-3-2-10]